MRIIEQISKTNLKLVAVIFILSIISSFNDNDKIYNSKFRIEFI